MNKFMETVKKYADKDRPTQCECPLCQGTIFIRYNDFTDGIQAMCDSCGAYWFEGSEDDPKENNV